MQSSRDRRTFSKSTSVLDLPAIFCLLFFVDYSQLITYISFSFWKGKGKSLSWYLTLWDPMGCSQWNSPGQNSGVGSLSLLQGIFLTQGSNPGLPHCRRILYQLSHKKSPRILEWVAYPFSNGSSWPRNRTGVSCIAGRFYTNWTTREARPGDP